MSAPITVQVVGK